MIIIIVDNLFISSIYIRLNRFRLLILVIVAIMIANNIDKDSNLRGRAPRNKKVGEIWLPKDSWYEQVLVKSQAYAIRYSGIYYLIIS
jgi:hypothetical protein